MTRTLSVLTWADYVSEDLTGLLSKHGIEVEWSFFDRNEEALASVAQRPERYDVIFADGLWPRVYFEQGLVHALDVSKFAGWHEIGRDLRERCVALWSVGGQDQSIAAFPAYWGVRGLIYDPLLLGQVESWQALWHAPRGTAWLNSQGSEILAEVALALGHPADMVYQLGEAELVDVSLRLNELMSRAGGVWQLLDQLEQAFDGGASIAEVHSTSLVHNLSEHLGRRLEVCLPEEGVICWIDGAMIARASEQRECAARFIELALSPDAVRLQWEQSDGYWSTNKRAMAELEEDSRHHVKARDALDAFECVRTAAMYRMPNRSGEYARVWKRALELVGEVPEQVRAEALHLAST